MDRNRNPSWLLWVAEVDVTAYLMHTLPTRPFESTEYFGARYSWQACRHPIDPLDNQWRQLA